jgi:hypothetical protein
MKYPGQSGPTVTFLVLGRRRHEPLFFDGTAPHRIGTRATDDALGGLQR